MEAHASRSYKATVRGVWGGQGASAEVRLARPTIFNSLMNTVAWLMGGSTEDLSGVVKNPANLCIGVLIRLGYFRAALRRNGIACE